MHLPFDLTGTGRNVSFQGPFLKLFSLRSFRFPDVQHKDGHRNLIVVGIFLRQRTQQREKHFKDFGQMKFTFKILSLSISYSSNISFVYHDLNIT